MKTKSIDDILSTIPHRYPFVLIDKILDYEKNKFIVAIKNVTVNEPQFMGHFPERPIMPGVLLIESMAQTAGALAVLSTDSQDNPYVYLTGVDKARFKQMVRPGDQLTINVEVNRVKSRLWKFFGKIMVEEKMVCSCDLTLVSE